MKWLPSLLFLASTLCADILDPDEIAVIRQAVEANIPREHQMDFMKLLVAIRKTENGSSGREFGILDPRADTLDLQARWCVATCYKNWLRWLKTDQETPYLLFLASRYAPVGCDTDNGTNQHWLGNVTYFLEKQQ